MKTFDEWQLQHFSQVVINPKGLSYASGTEDGYVRLHFFDKSYLDMKDPILEEEEPSNHSSFSSTYYFYLSSMAGGSK